MVWGTFDGAIFMVLQEKKCCYACVVLHQGLPLTTALLASSCVSLRLHSCWKCIYNAKAPFPKLY